MIKKLSVFIYFIIFLTINISAKDTIINKVLYKKTVLSYNQKILINVFLNPMNIRDVIVIFNNKEIENINKNFNSMVVGDNNFLPSFSFEADNLLKTSILEVFVILTDDVTLNTELTLYFKKGIIVEDNLFQVSKDVVFFIKTGDLSNNGISYLLEMDEQGILQIIEKVVQDNILYYKIKSIRTGSTKVNIYKFDEYYKSKYDQPVKSINVNVVR